MQYCWMGKLECNEHVARFRMDNSIVQMIVRTPAYEKPNQWIFSIFDNNDEGEVNYIKTVQGNVITLCWFDAKGNFYKGNIIFSKMINESTEPKILFTFYNKDNNICANGYFELSDIKQPRDR